MEQLDGVQERSGRREGGRRGGRWVGGEGGGGRRRVGWVGGEERGGKLELIVATGEEEGDIGFEVQGLNGCVEGQEGSDADASGDEHHVLVG